MKVSGLGMVKNCNKVNKRILGYFKLSNYLFFLVSHNVTNQAPKVSTIVERDENMVSELGSAKAQIANLQHLNKTLSESCEKMKKDYEIME